MYHSVRSILLFSVLIPSNAGAKDVAVRIVADEDGLLGPNSQGPTTAVERRRMGFPVSPPPVIRDDDRVDQGTDSQRFDLVSLHGGVAVGHNAKGMARAQSGEDTS